MTKLSHWDLCKADLTEIKAGISQLNSIPTRDILQEVIEYGIKTHVCETTVQGHKILSLFVFKNSVLILDIEEDEKLGIQRFFIFFFDF